MQVKTKSIIAPSADQWSWRHWPVCKHSDSLRRPAVLKYRSSFKMVMTSMSVPISPQHGLRHPTPTLSGLAGLQWSLYPGWSGCNRRVFRLSLTAPSSFADLTRCQSSARDYQAMNSRLRSSRWDAREGSQNILSDAFRINSCPPKAAASLAIIGENLRLRYITTERRRKTSCRYL